MNVIATFRYSATNMDITQNTTVLLIAIVCTSAMYISNVSGRRMHELAWMTTLQPDITGDSPVDVCGMLVECRDILGPVQPGAGT
jgi:hypothetical protein